MSKSYIETNLYTKELEEKMNDSVVYPLIKQLHLLYGLKVYQMYPIFYTEYPGENKNIVQYRYVGSRGGELDVERDKIVDAFLMGTEGIPEVLVYWDIPEKKYSVHHKNLCKERGKDGWARRTISSKKISQLLKTINRKDIDYNAWHNFPIDVTDIISSYKIDGKDIEHYKEQVMRHHRGLSYGGAAIKNVLKLVQSVYGKKKAITHEEDKFFKEFMDTNKNLCDAYESAKKIAEADSQSGFYAFGINRFTKGIIQGEYKKYSKISSSSDIDLENSKALKQIKDSEFYKNVEPILTMLKVKIEDNRPLSSHGIIEDYWINTNYTTWVEDLGILYKASVIGNKANYNPFDIQWLLISKGEECNTQELKME